MDGRSFELLVTREGNKPAHRNVQPGLALEEHDHAWDTKGQVLKGGFTGVCAGTALTHGRGDVFEWGAGISHAEHAGPDGAELVVGRRAMASRQIP